jgi:hypothetical protein
MIKQSVHEAEIMSEMDKELNHSDSFKSAINDLGEAVEHINSAAEILDNMGFVLQADKLLSILVKVANDADPHTKGLNSDKMVKNLLDHGTVFNMADDQDLLNADVGENLEVTDDSDMDFEDEL